jgi:hypothetical protein
MWPASVGVLAGEAPRPSFHGRRGDGHPPGAGDGRGIRGHEGDAVPACDHVDHQFQAVGAVSDDRAPAVKPSTTAQVT